MEKSTKGTWTSISAADWKALPETPGVYVICLLCYSARDLLENQPTYVGSTVNLRHRFREHCFSSKGLKARLHPCWDDLTIKYSESRKYGDWMMRELRLIRRLQPDMNTKNRGVKP